mgnify:CR=1 FL=1
MRTSLALLVLLMVVLPAVAEPVEYGAGQRAIGPIVVGELAIRDGVLTFRAESGGCTDSGSFEVDVVQEDNLVGIAPHYVLTIRRVRADDCKALFWEGVLVEIDLEDDLGLAGFYTVTVTNPVLQGPPEEE